MKKIISTLNESGYDGVANIYELWCTGDENFYPSLDFYYEYLSSHEGPFLELGIGTGRIALEILRNYKKRIIGVDISKNMLAECLKNYQELKRQNPDIGSLQLIQGNMKDIQFTEEFEVVYLPFRTVGHLITNEEMNQVFNKVYKALIKGGYFVFDHYIFQQDWAMAHNRINIPMYSDEINNIFIVDYYDYDFEKELMNCSILLNGTIVQRFAFRWLHPETIREVAISAGFTIENVYGSFDKADFTEHSFNQIWELKK